MLRTQEIAHARVKRVELRIFTERFTADCMTHACKCMDEQGQVRLDACCQHGADVDLFEKREILARTKEIQAVINPAFADPARWFDESDPYEDPEYPSGVAVRTATQDGTESSGCVFLAHDGRGCALHRTALENGFDPDSIKPVVCRLYPLGYGDGELGLSDDYERYSCAGDTSGPTVYQLMRGVLLSVFGQDLITRLDSLEGKVLKRHLPLVANL